jgi:hypothetical protein
MAPPSFFCQWPLCQWRSGSEVWESLRGGGEVAVRRPIIEEDDGEADEEEEDPGQARDVSTKEIV